MFHEHRELIAKLRQEDNHFSRLFDKHNELDTQIEKLANNPVTATSEPEEIEKLKKEKLHLKDEIYAYLLKKQKEQ